MSLISSIIRKTTLPQYLSLKGLSGQLDYLNRYAAYDRMTSYQIAQVQSKGLKALMKHVFQNSPYYNKVFKKLGVTPIDIESFEDLQKFPVLTKEDIRNNIDEILAKNYPIDMRSKAATGGSTGLPLEFWRDYTCRDKKLAMALNFKGWYGYRPGDKQLFLWGASQDYNQKPSLKAKVVRNLATRDWFVTINDLKAANLEKTVRRIGKLKPDLVAAYPNIIYSFARMITKKGLSLKLKKIVCSAEQMFDYQREYLHEVFGAEIYEKYGSREVGTIASECSQHSGMHYFAPGIFLETIDFEGNPAGSNLGNLLVTDLWNYAMPLIRYQVGDMVRMDPVKCPCGCELPKIAQIEGRVVDLIVKPNGEMMAGQALIGIIRESNIKVQTQIIQKEVDKYIINYVSDTDLPEKNVRFIQSSFNHVFNQPVEIEFVKKSILERDKSGKFRYIKSEVDAPFKK
jgi:phenylacetate-coenzyme A ligase PaaK-like adenylate-forming protein